MKERPVLIVAIALTLIVEIALMVLVYNKIGDERLPSQIGRVIFQLIFIALILTRKSNIALFVLSGYHIISGLYASYMNSSPDSMELGFGFYHIGIGLIIYFHEVIENKLKLKT